MLKKITPVMAAIALPLTLCGYSSSASANSNVEFKASIKAVCTLSVASPVDLGDIAITEFTGKSAGEEISGHDKTFAITTNCVGADKYTLTMTPTKVNSGCLESGSEELAYCLYDTGGSKINLAVAGTSLERDTTVTTETIKVVPARASKAPTAGDHSGTMTVTIMPL